MAGFRVLHPCLLREVSVPALIIQDFPILGCPLELFPAYLLMIFCQRRPSTAGALNTGLLKVMLLLLFFLATHHSW